MFSSLNPSMLRAVLAIARSGSPSQAATALRVTPSTIYRQIDSLEHDIGNRVFERHRDGWTPNQFGKKLVEIATKTESGLRDFQLLVQSNDNRTSGLLRVTVSDGEANFYVARKLAALLARHPELTIELLVTNRRLDLASGEADVAIRPHSQPGEGLTGRRAGVMLHAIYAAQSYLQEHGVPRQPSDLSQHHVCGYGEALSHFSAATWTMRQLGGTRPVARFDQLTALARAVEGGMGLAVLPCYIGDQLADSKLIMYAGDGLPADIWLISHRSQRKNIKVRNFFAFFQSAFRQDAALFKGQR
jgi:DNA-binding transcriptional LysR family regulator